MGSRLNLILAELLKAKKTNQQILSAKFGKVHVEAPLMGGKEIYPKMMQGIQSAEHEVLLMGYKLDAGCDAEEDLLAALDALNEKAARENKKISVKILINYKAGAAGYFRPQHKNPTFKQKRYANLDFQYAEHTHNAFGSFHSKMLIIDGRTAFIGSADLFKVGDYRDGESRQVDTTSVLHGNAFVSHMREDFFHAWNSKQVNKYMANTPIEEYPMESQLPEGVPALFISKKAVGDNRKDLSPFTLALIHAIENAEYSINIMTVNLNVPEVIAALAAANKRGVPIRLVMGRNTNDAAEAKIRMGGNNRNNVKKLMKAVQSSPYRERLEVRWATDDAGEEVIPDHHKNKLHGRVSCIDDLVFVGSSVLDLQSAYHSRESDVIMESEAVAKMYMKDIFLPNFDKGVSVEWTGKTFVENKHNSAEYLSDALQSLDKIVKDGHVMLGVNYKQFMQMREMLFNDPAFQDLQPEKQVQKYYQLIAAFMYDPVNFHFHHVLINRNINAMQVALTSNLPEHSKLIIKMLQQPFPREDNQVNQLITLLEEYLKNTTLSSNHSKIKQKAINFKNTIFRKNTRLKGLDNKKVEVVSNALLKLRLLQIGLVDGQTPADIIAPLLQDNTLDRRYRFGQLCSQATTILSAFATNPTLR